MRGFRAAALLSVALLPVIAPGSASAHAGLTRSDPAPGATLGASPTAVRLSFSEQPAATLSSIRVLDGRGVAVPRQTAHPRPAAGDPLSLVVPVRPLGRGVYRVDWRVVSAVDGHASVGSYAFGVRASPRGAAVTGSSAKQATSKLELLARWILLMGLALLVGSSVAGVARFGGSSGTDLLLAVAGALVAIVGLLLFAEAQRRTAGSSLSALLETPVGDALIWRAATIVAAGLALLLARRLPRLRTAGLLVAAACAVAAIAVHVDAGHAAAGSWPSALTVLAQTTHFTAAGIWFGGLAALLAGLAHANSTSRAAAVRRFSTVALAALVVVAATGTVRAIDELSTLGDLASTGYGRAIVAKAVLLALIVAVAARNRRRGVTSAGADPAPLRRMSRAELGLATVALAVAALLGSLAPPVAGRAAEPSGITATGSDAAKTVRVKLRAASAEPGPNAFTVRAEDYRSGDELRGAHVRLSFSPRDDPGVRATDLPLTPSADGSYSGTGANLRFDGRWRVTVLVERQGTTTEAPLDVELPSPDHFVSVLRAPGEPPAYTMQLESVGYIRLSPDPERPGPSTVRVDVFDDFQSEAPLKSLVVTAAADGPAHQVAVRRSAPNRGDATVTLERGSNTIAVVARTKQGLRMRGVFDLKVPGG